MYNVNSPNSGPHGGSALVIRNEIAHSLLPINTELLAVAARLQLSTTLTICSLYLPPNNQINQNDLQNIIAQLPEPFIIMGDLNARSPLWGDTVTNRNGRTVEQLLENSTIDIANTNNPTHYHIQTNSMSYIDLTLCSAGIINQFEWFASRDLYNSDHFPTVIKSEEEINYLSTPRFKYDAANWNLFKQLAVMPYSINDFENTNDAVEAVTKCIIDAAEQSIPKTKGGLFRKCVPWWNPEIGAARKEKRKLQRQYYRTRLIEHREEFTRARAKFRYLVKQSRQKSWRDYISSINSSTPINKVWAKIDKIRGKHASHRTPMLQNPDGSLITDPHEVGNIFGQSLSTISRGSQDPEFLQIKRNTAIPNLIEDRMSEYNLPFTRPEYENAVKLSHNSAPGEDLTHHQMIKSLPEETILFIIALFNKIWNTHCFPNKWKNAIILPFTKPGKDPLMASNYRPISLTSCLCKLMERMVNTRLVWALESRGILNTLQYGFRNGRSTIDVLARIDTDIKTALANNQHTMAIFFDLTKAYDTTWKMGILRTLVNGGIKGNMTVFIRNFLSDRTMKVRIGSSLSNPHPQHEGVPQGSVLSCTLFSLAINSITNNLPINTNSTLYVDDLCIYSSSHNLRSLERKIQNAANKLSRWSTQHGFTFSHEKSVVMHFHKKRRIFPPPDIHLNRQRLRVVEQTRFLGMIMDRKLSWIPHLKQLKQDCLKSMSLLKSISRKAWGADRQSLLHIYRSLIRSKLDYGCQIYSSANPSSLKMLNSVHNLGIRLSTGAFRTSPTDSLYADSGEPSLEHRREKLSLQLLARILAMPETPSHTSITDPAQDQLFANRPYHNTLGTRTRQTLQALQQEQPKIRRSLNYTNCPWTTPVGRQCESISELCKKNTPPLILKTAFQHHQDTHHRNETKIYTDGSKSEAGTAFSCILPTIQVGRRIPSASSIFSAELLAIKHALAVTAGSNYTNIVIHSDSKSSLQAIGNQFTKHPIVNDIHSYLRMLCRRGIEICFCWVPSHIGVAGNEAADQKAKSIAESNGFTIDIDLPFKDYYPEFRRWVHAKWKRSWIEAAQTNKLRSIKDSTTPCATSYQRGRQGEVMTARLRIGHTRLTHAHLLLGEERPFCEDCIVPLTIKHILTECPSYTDERRNTFGPNEIQMSNILNDNLQNINRVLSCINAIGLTNEI